MLCDHIVLYVACNGAFQVVVCIPWVVCEVILELSFYFII
jgi:hypothetical protein